jgi:hypothetical protein
MRRRAGGDTLEWAGAMRRIVPALVFVSFTLFCAIVICWLYSALDPVVSVRRTFHGVALVPHDNSVLDQPGGGPELLESNLSILPKYARSGFRLLGFQYWAGGTPNAGVGGIPSFWVVVVPYWSLLLLTGAGPAWWWRSRRTRQRRLRRGLCAACGYDLRESRDHCPECGAPATPRGIADPARA